MAPSSQFGLDQLAVGVAKICHDDGLVWYTAAVVGDAGPEDAEHVGGAGSDAAAEAGEAAEDDVLGVRDAIAKGGQRNWEVFVHAIDVAAVYNAVANIPGQAEEAGARLMRGKLVQDRTELARPGVVETIESAAKEAPAAREDLDIRCGRKREEELFGYGP